MLRIFLVLILLLTSCSSSNVSKNTFATSGLKIGSVQVVIDNSLDEGRANTFKKLNGTGLIKEHMQSQLARRNLRNEDSKIKMIVDVKEFRLRHGATVFFAGALAGRDQIAALVQLFDDNALILSFETDYGAFGRGHNIGQEGRGNRLFLGLAEQTVKELLRGHFQPLNKNSNSPATSNTLSPDITHSKSSTSSADLKNSPDNARDCSVAQILEMKKLKLSDKQIKNACNQ